MWIMLRYVKFQEFPFCRSYSAPGEGWKLLRSLSVKWFGLLMAPVQSDLLSPLQLHRYGQCLGRGLQSPTGNLVPKTLNCGSRSWSVCWKQGSLVILCLVLHMFWYVISSIFNLCSLFWWLTCWDNDLFSLLSNMTISTTFPFPLKVFAWSWWIPKLTLF